jgi:hypothetical protein
MTARILYSQKSGDSLFAVANKLRKSSKRELQEGVFELRTRRYLR